MTRGIIAAISHIEIMESATGRHARIARRGFKVRVLVELVVYANTPIDYVAEHYDLTLAEIHAALAYYYDHKEEIDAEIAEHHRLEEEMMANHVPTRLELLIEQRRKERAANEEKADES